MFASPGRARAKAVAFMVVIPALISGAIQKAMWGGFDDKDHDGYSDEFAKWFFGQQLHAVGSMVPVLGPMAVTLLESEGERFAVSPATTALQSTARGLGALYHRAAGDKEELKGRDVRDLLTALSVATGLPFASLGREAQYQVDVGRGAVRPSGQLDYLRGLLTGAGSPGTRR